MSSRLKVLISAYACSPSRGSEPGVGWGFVRQLSRHHDLWVIVEEEKFREEIEGYLSAHPGELASVKFFFIAKKRNRLLRKIWPPSYYWYYRSWQLQAFRLAEDLHQKVGFDLAHQLTMVGFREPGYLWKLGVPFVWGPVGGMGFFPWRFLSVMGVYGALYYLGYNIFNAWQMRFSLRPRLAARAAEKGLIAATRENQAGAMRFWGCSSTVISEVGLPHHIYHQPTSRQLGEPLRLVWTGQHTPGKALNLALEALARLPSSVEWELHVLGEGKCTSRWKRMAESLGIAGRCHFHGWKLRDEALSVMGDSHVMVMTSLRDLTATVTVEALAMGLPILCLDHCGFGSVVDETCGIKVNVSTPEKTVDGLAAGIRALADDELMRFRLAQGAVALANEFSWERKAEAVCGVYQDVISGHWEKKF